MGFIIIIEGQDLLLFNIPKAGIYFQPGNKGKKLEWPEQRQQQQQAGRIYVFLPLFPCTCTAVSQAKYVGAEKWQ